MSLKAFLQPRFDPGQKLRGRKTLRRARSSVVVLSRHHEFLPVDVKHESSPIAPLFLFPGLKFLPTITVLSLQGALQPGKMSLFCALAEWLYAVGSLLQ
jgi:hypothetical protein